MRRTLTFACEGSSLAASLDEGERTTGLLIVSGGNEIRSGAHRGMAQLAQTIAAADWPVFRFDRRGVGDSEGVNGGYLSSGPDIAAARRAFRSQCPHLQTIVAFGNCDAATALVLHDAEVDARVLANPWVVEPRDALPPPAAIRDRYARRLRDPAAWAALLTGRIDLKALAKGLGRIASPAPTTPDSLAARFVAGIASRPTTILLAERDVTAIAFADEWQRCFVEGIAMRRLDSASHSFAQTSEAVWLEAALLDVLEATSSPQA